jgi:hypothetical protein
MRRTAAISFAAGVALALAAEHFGAHRGGRPPAGAAADEQSSAIIERLDDQQKMLSLVLSRARPACAGRAAPPPPAAPAGGESAAKQPETPESAAAFQDAQRLLHDASGAGRWTEHDRLELRAMFGRMSPAAQGELLRQLAVAVNQDRIKLDRPGPPF